MSVDVRILVINDPHVAATPPRGCKSIYTEDVFNLLTEAREIADRRGVDVTVFTGDMFHHKQNVADWIKIRLIGLLKDWPGEKLAIVGNHDLGAAGLASVDSQPIGVLFEAGVLEWLYKDEVRWYSGEGWGDPISVQWSPANYTDDIDSDPANFGLKRLPNVKYAIKVAHGSIVMKDKDWPEEFQVVPVKNIPTEGMDFCIFGHIHNDQGMRKVNDCIFIGTGSLGRVARSDYNYKKPMRLPLITLEKDGASTEFIDLKSGALPEDLFYDKAAPDVEFDEPMAKFTRNIESMLSVEGTSIEQALAASSEGKLDPRVAAAVKKHLVESGWE